jgi:hypothetical protein
MRPVRTLALVFVVVLLTTLHLSSALAATFTVDNVGDAADFSTSDGVCDTNDSSGNGPCTLRAAIQQANSTLGSDLVFFNIPGAGSHTIQPASALPTITDPVIINGYSEPGSSPNTSATSISAVLMIELDGINAGPSTDGLTVTGSGTTVQGLVIRRFGGNGIQFASATGGSVRGNFIGTDVTGTLDLGNLNAGVFVNSSTNVEVGTTALSTRNLISGNEAHGVSIGGGTGNLVAGNLVGTDKTGALALRNSGNGVYVSGSSGNLIGGTGSTAHNVISGNAFDGVRIEGAGATGNQVLGNLIGTNASSSALMGNFRNGVAVAGVSGNAIGGTATGAGNVIAGNDSAGVAVQSGGTGNTIRGNSTYSNGGSGIDNASGGNLELAPPVISSTGSAAGTACANCTIDVYSDDLNEGRVYHGQTTADATGRWRFSGAVTGPLVTATATDASGNTSEFAYPFPLTEFSGIVAHPVGSVAWLWTPTKVYAVDFNAPTVASEVTVGGSSIADVRGVVAHPVGPKAWFWTPSKVYAADFNAPTVASEVTVGGASITSPAGTGLVVVTTGIAPGSPEFGSAVIGSGAGITNYTSPYTVATVGASPGMPYVLAPEVCAAANRTVITSGYALVGSFFSGTGFVDVGPNSALLITAPQLQDSDGDGWANPCDNCPLRANADQALPSWSIPANDPDCDGLSGATEAYCGANPESMNSIPERIDGAFAPTDDDGDTLIGEVLPPGAAALDCDGDGYSGAPESGAPLCGNRANDDGVISAGSDDSVVDDGCPGGPPQVGAYSEAQFNITLTDQDPCGMNGWPSDFLAGGIFGSTNRVLIDDLNSFLSPRRLDTNPGDQNFNTRWDLVPGRGIFNDWINIQDFNALLGGTTAYPPMLGGERALNGPSCPWPP